MAKAGAFVWFEFLNLNNEAALAFYPAVLGWSVHEWGGDFVYAGASVSEGWMAYVGCADATAQRVKEHGGTVLAGPIDIPGAGRMYAVADPQGAVFSLHQSATPEAEGGAPPAPSAISWVELVTDDHEASWPFYESCFGWTTQQVLDLGPMGTYRSFGLGRTPKGGTMNRSRSGPHARPPRWRLYGRVVDLNHALSRARDLGATIVSGPNAVLGGDLVAVLVDPQGLEFALHQVVPAAG